MPPQSNEMKLATLKDGTRDGRLMVVSKDLTRAGICAQAPRTLAATIECWSAVAPHLQATYDAVNEGTAAGIAELPLKRLAAPLPRGPQWLDASAFHSHGDLMERVLGLPCIEGKLDTPLMYQGASDDFLGGHDDLPVPSEADGIDFEAEVAVVVDYVPMGTPASRALPHIKLLLLANDVSLRILAGREIKSGFGFIQSKPSTSFGPAAITPDELGKAWHDGRVHLPVRVDWNDRLFGTPHAGAMGFGFHELIAHAARTRNLHAGTIIGSGTISNAEYRTVGSACIAERRGIEILDHGQASTPYMKFGDTVRIEMLDEHKRSLFGAIHQHIVEANPAAI
jgi:fumarylacetoacetate (FAA) hydrolase